MNYWLAAILLMFFYSCAPDTNILTSAPEMRPADTARSPLNDAAAYPGQIVKSPQGYVLNGPKDRFGSFRGDCASEENFPYYWECQAENAGDNFH